MTSAVSTQDQTVATSLQTPLRMTFEEFLEWGDEDVRAEWVDGEVKIMVRPTVRHQLLLDFLGALLAAYLIERPIGRKFPETLFRLPGLETGRVPDILFLLNEHLARVQDKHVEGPADLVIEIVSEESQDRDRGAKFSEYEAAGVAEYWLIDPLREMADFYHLGEDGRYDRLAPDAEGRFPSVVLPGLRVDPAWLWQDPPPTLAEALAWVRAMLAE